MADWTQLDDLVQVSYSVTEAVIVYSRYTDQAWWLHVFRESEAYAVVFEGTAGMEKIMQKRQPLASNASSFIEWFVSSMIQGFLYVTFKRDKCKLSVGQELSLELDVSEGSAAILWQLVVKMALHIQKRDGCRVKQQQTASSSDKIDEEKKRLRELERENERLASMVTQTSTLASASMPPSTVPSSSSQPDETEPPPPLSPSTSGGRTAAAVTVTPTLSAVRRKRKGMSLINPRAKRLEKEDLEFEDIDNESNASDEK